jgi:hypothetical protein
MLLQRLGLPQLDEFISKYPNSDWIDIATYRRDYTALNRQKASGHAAFEVPAEIPKERVGR